MPYTRIPLREIQGELAIYLNWSANALMPISPGASDVYLSRNFDSVYKIAQRLLLLVNTLPETIYRGVILKEPTREVKPHKSLMHLSFSTDKAVAEHFADIKGFGYGIIDIPARLGEHGYVIEYSPNAAEILFHYEFLSLLPYAEAFDLLRMDGILEVKSLMKQKEIVIIQPSTPFTNISSVNNLKS